MLHRLLCISKPYSASNMFVSLCILSFAELLRYLSIDLKTELSLVQTLSLQPDDHHCYMFHPLFVNGVALFFILTNPVIACTY